MRKSDREVRSQEEIRAILSACKVLHLGVTDEEGIYLVPLNFGYTFENGELCLYFHSAKDGRKVKAIRQNPEVGFEMDVDLGIIKGEEACGYSWAYKSIVGKGRAEILTDSADKKRGLSLLMEHYTQHAFCFTKQMIDSVAVVKIMAESFSAKKNGR